MVTKARTAACKICWKLGCFDYDILAAMDEDVSDGVHVISLSISSNGYASHYYSDSITIGVFSAIQYSVVASCSAGNSGPGPYTSVNIAPGILTARASTIDRGWNARVEMEETLTAILILKRSIEVPNKNAVNRLGLLLMKVEGIPLLLVLDDVWQNSEPLIEKIQFLISDFKIRVTSRVAFLKFSTTCVLKLLEKLCVNMPLLSNDSRYAFSDPLAKQPYFTSNTIATPPLPPEPPDKSLYIVVTMLSVADLNLLCGHRTKSHFWFFTIIQQYSTQAFPWAWQHLNIILRHIAKVLNFGAYVITCWKNSVVVVDILGILPNIEKNNIQHDALFVPCNLVTIFQGFESYVKKSIYGCTDGTKCVSAEIDEAVEVAKKVDYVILDQTQERNYHDRDHFIFSL